jgi:hypothetical protein
LGLKLAHELFAEYAALAARGERPRASEYLSRAGAEADLLAGMIDRYLRAAPRQSATLEDSVRLASLLRTEPPILEQRVRQGLRRAAVVDALLEALGLDSRNRDRLAEAYHELETGQLDPAGVDPSVWTALGEILKANVRELGAWRGRPLAAKPAFRLSEQRRADFDAILTPSKTDTSQEDEVDRLFRSGGRA